MTVHIARMSRGDGSPERKSGSTSVETGGGGSRNVGTLGQLGVLGVYRCGFLATSKSRDCVLQGLLIGIWVLNQSRMPQIPSLGCRWWVALRHEFFLSRSTMKQGHLGYI
jgi:hypothetical protein